MKSSQIVLIFIVILTSACCAESEGQLFFSTYLGSDKRDWISDMCIDENGDVYVVDSTESPNFPTTPGKIKNRFSGNGRDVFIAKFGQTGELLFSTLLGGDEYDTDCQMEIDNNGNIIITGVTNSLNLPVTDNAYMNRLQGEFDLFITKMNSECDTILFSTYLGGSNHDRHPVLALDDIGNIYVAGPTVSADFPTTENAYDREYNGMSGYYGDIYICKLDTYGVQLLYSSYIGGSKDETVFGIYVDAEGTAYLTGYTESENFPFTRQMYGTGYSVSSNVNDAFLVALNCQNSELTFSTLFGGNGSEQGQQVCLDQTGNIFISGTTTSDNFPVTQGSFDETFNGGNESGDFFVSKFINSGKELIYSTYVGGIADEGRSDLIIDNAGNAFVGGGTSSTNFPVTISTYDSLYNGGDDVFSFRDALLFKLNSSGDKLLYSTFLGGTGDVLIGGLTTSPDFPTTPQAYDNSYYGSWDAFLMMLDLSYERSSNLESMNIYGLIQLNHNFTHSNQTRLDLLDGDKLNNNYSTIIHYFSKIIPENLK
jgi:hypothetical protein